MDDFVKLFIDEKIDAVKLGDKFFKLEPEIAEFKDKIKLKPFMVSNYMGKIIKGKFVPSFILLDMLSEISEKKVVVKDIGEIDFLYGKNLKKRHILKCPKDHPAFVLVINEFGNCLGYGKLKSKKELTVKNEFDRGDFLRREKK